MRFLGYGSAFNTELGNTSGYIKKHSSMVLFDCGGTVYHKINKLNLLEGIENLYIVITHTHPDHVGSIGEVIFYLYYVLNKKAKVIFPNKLVIEKFLEATGVTGEMYSLISEENITLNDNILGKINIEFVTATHVDTIPAYGFIFKGANESFYYSGDTSVIRKEMIDKLKNGEINAIYHDTCGLDYPNNSHTSLKKQIEEVPVEVRDKFYCVHLDKNIIIEDIISAGFKLVR